MLTSFTQPQPSAAPVNSLRKGDFKYICKYFSCYKQNKITLDIVIFFTEIAHWFRGMLWPSVLPPTKSISRTVP